ncbi:hypothetical protein [Flavobacterium sp.]
MKKIFLITLLLLSVLSFSQMNRRIGRAPTSNMHKKIEKVDPVQASTNYLKKELSLDTFQEAAIKTFLEENQKEKDYVLTLDINDSDKIAKLKVSYDKMDAQINTLLNSQQKETFLQIKEKKTGKDKKKKNKKETAEEVENE